MHPGILVAGVFGTVVTGVVLYAIFREEIHSLLESQIPISSSSGQSRQRRQRQEREEQDNDRGYSTSTNEGSYELRRRRRPEDEEDEKSEDTELLERLRKVEESERANAAQAARLEAMERSLLQLQENLERSMHEQDKLRESIERQHVRPQSPEFFNPFASNEPLIRNYSPDESHLHRRPSSASSSSVNSHNPNNAHLRHNHQENNNNPFADSSLLRNHSSSSIIHDSDHFRDVFDDADDRSLTIGNDDDEHDWTEAEIGSIGSHDSDESWVAQ